MLFLNLIWGKIIFIQKSELKRQVLPWPIMYICCGLHMASMREPADQNFGDVRNSSGRLRYSSPRRRASSCVDSISPLISPHDLFVSQITHPLSLCWKNPLQNKWTEMQIISRLPQRTALTDTCHERSIKGEHTALGTNGLRSSAAETLCSKKYFKKHSAIKGPLTWLFVCN